MSGKTDAQRPIPHSEEWRKLLDEAGLPPAEQAAYQELVSALARELGQPERPRPGFQAELRARLMEEAQRTLGENPSVDSRTPAGSRGPAEVRPLHRQRRSRRWTGVAGWGAVAAAAAAGVILWLGRPDLAPLPAGASGGVAQSGPETAGPAGGSGSSGTPDSPDAPGSGGTELPVSPPVEISGPGLGTGPATTAGDHGGGASDPAVLPAGTTVAHAGVQVPATEQPAESAPLRLTWGTAQVPPLPGQVTLYALDTRPWSQTTIDRAVRLISPSRAQSLGGGGLDARSADGLRRLRLTADHVLTYQAAAEPGQSPAPEDTTGSPGPVGSSGAAPDQPGGSTVPGPTPEGGLAAARKFLARFGLEPQGSPEVYPEPDGSWLVVFTPTLNGYPLVGGAGRMHLSADLQVTYLELRRLVAAPGPLAPLRSPEEAARDLEGQTVAGSGRVRITDVSLVYMPASQESGGEWAYPYYRFTGETAEGWPYVGYAPALAPAPAN